MAAGNDQGNEREFNLFFQEDSEKMGFNVIDCGKGNISAKGYPLGGRGTHQQGAYQAGTTGDGQTFYVGKRDSGITQCQVYNRNDTLKMLS
jgi:hypothetical protein